MSSCPPLCNKLPRALRVKAVTFYLSQFRGLHGQFPDSGTWTLVCRGHLQAQLGWTAQDGLLSVPRRGAGC